jgi:hypothetical protein
LSKFTLPYHQRVFEKFFIQVAMPILAVILFSLCKDFLKKAEEAREELKKLQYIW